MSRAKHCGSLTHSTWSDDDLPSADEMPTADHLGHLQVADLMGRARTVAGYRASGARRFRMLVDFADSETDESWGDPPSRHANGDPELVRRLLKRYELAGLTAAQLRTVRALWLERLTAREHARREKISVAAVSSRIRGGRRARGIADKAPEFMTFWNGKHGRRLGARDSSRRGRLPKVSRADQSPSQ
jgi:hypothetical protein